MSVTTTSGRWSSAAATREGAAALLAQAGEVEVVEAVSDLDGLLAAVERHRPDAVLTDIRMPPTKTTEGIDAARRIRRDYPGTGVVVLSQYAEEEYAYELLKDGAEGLGYLLKERVADVEEIVRALREVLGLMAEGRNNAAVAASLFLTERAVEKHINSLFHKLGLSDEPNVHRRVMAVLTFLREGGGPPAA